MARLISPLEAIGTISLLKHDATLQSCVMQLAKRMSRESPIQDDILEEFYKRLAKAVGITEQKVKRIRNLDNCQR